MAQQTLNIGTNANDGTGDTLRAAMDKVNDNFTEIYTAPGVSSDAILISGNSISAIRSDDDLIFNPSGSGSVVFDAIRFNGNNIEGTRSNENINLIPAGTGSVVFGSIKINGTSLSSDDSSIININDGLIVDGTLNVSGAATIGTMTAATGSTFGNLTLANGSITDSSGAISFGNENLTTTGTVAAATGSTLGNLTLANGSITDSSGAISFGNENLTTSGTLGVTGLATLGSLTVPGVTTLSTTNIDNLTLQDNTISSSSNADINLTPGGTGSVVVSNLTVDSNINITDNKITTTQSNSDLVIAPAGSGQVVMSKADINGGTIDNTTIGATTPLAGTFTTVTATTSAVIDGITITDNKITTNESNATLQLDGSGSGGVTISGFTFPTTDGSSGQFITTDGAGALSFATAGATLSNSSIADAVTTVASSAVSTLNTFNKTTVRSAKYFISITDTANSKFEIVEANVTHDGTNAFITAFGSTSSFEPDGSSTTATPVVFSADIDGNDVRVRVQCSSSDSTVFKFQRVVLNI